MAPAARGGTEVNNTRAFCGVGMGEEVELLIDLNEFEGGTSAPVLLFCESIVGVSFVLG